jgi:hypothetical protein
LDEALSIIVTVPLALPVVVGLKTVVMVQLPPEATLDPQVLRAWNRPLTLIEAMDKATDPVLVRVTVCGELVVPTSWKG